MSEVWSTKIVHLNQKEQRKNSTSTNNCINCTEKRQMPTLYELSDSMYTDLVNATTHSLLVELFLQELVIRQQHGPPQHNPTPSPLPTSTSNTPPIAATTLTNTPGIQSAMGTRQPTPNAEVQGRTNWVCVPGRDVFGLEKVSDSSRYFDCSVCGRSVAGSRFAVHLERCLGRGRAK